MLIGLHRGNRLFLHRCTKHLYAGLRRRFKKGKRGLRRQQRDERRRLQQRVRRGKRMELFRNAEQLFHHLRRWY